MTHGLGHTGPCVDGKQAATVPLSGSTALGCEATVSIEGAKWLTVECYGAWPEFATTNAWYVAQ